MKISRRAAIGAVASGIALLKSSPEAAALEKKSVTIGVGGSKSLLYYLPLTIAERKGFFKEEGLDVTIQEFPGGGRALQALVGGSVDAVTGAYEHSLRMQAKGQDVRSIIELGRLPGIVLGVRTALADKVKRPGDLKGMKIGVAARGSSTEVLARYLLARDNVAPDDVSFITVGTGAQVMAAMRRGEIDAVSAIELAITSLERDGLIRPLADLRTEEATRALFGATNPAAALLTYAAFIDRNPASAQALVNAFYKALKWLETATPEQVLATVPEEYHLGDRDLYMVSLKHAMASYSRTGVIAPESSAAAMKLFSFDEEIGKGNFDLSKTFDGRFVQKLQPRG